MSGTRIPCRTCGEMFHPTNRRGPNPSHCSVICQSRAPRKQRVCVCSECQRPFLTREPRTICCSDACRQERKRHVGLTHPKCVASWESNRKWPSRRDAERAYSVQRRLVCRDREPYSEQEIYERDGWLCQLCGHEVDRSLVWPHRMSATIDHRLPISKGGADTPQNVWLAHLSCNSRKGAMDRWSGERTPRGLTS
jgi:hypothetical protein